MSAPRVSVVVPTHNRRDLLIETLASVRDQTLADWELLVVDDDSSDGTAEYLDGLVDPRLRRFRPDKHGERSAARNLGLANAHADFIMFLDDDDLLRPNALRLLVSELDADPDLVAAVGSRRFREINQDSTFHFQTSKAATVHHAWRDLLFNWTPNSGQNLYRADVVRAVGGYDTRCLPCEDRAMWLRIAHVGPVRVIPKVVLEYRVHSGQSKPLDVDRIRETVFRDFIATLSPDEGEEALRLRRAVAIGQDDFSSWFQTIVTAPYLLGSPISRRPLWWQLRDMLLRIGRR